MYIYAHLYLYLDHLSISIIYIYIYILLAYKSDNVRLIFVKIYFSEIVAASLPDHPSIRSRTTTVSLACKGSERLTQTLY